LEQDAAAATAAAAPSALVCGVSTSSTGSTGENAAGNPYRRSGYVNGTSSTATDAANIVLLTALARTSSAQKRKWNG
jgi:hypothetical protein